MRTTCQCCGRPLLRSGDEPRHQAKRYCDSCQIAGCPSALASRGRCARGCPGALQAPCVCCGKSMPIPVRVFTPRHRDDKEIYHTSILRKRCDRCVLLGCRVMKGKPAPSRRCPAYKKPVDRLPAAPYTPSQKGGSRP